MQDLWPLVLLTQTILLPPARLSAQHPTCHGSKPTPIMKAGANTVRRMAMAQDSREPLIEAGAIVPVYRRDDGHPVLVVVRRTPWGIHGGQLAFPGGKRESGDMTIVETALREAWEEIGLVRESVAILEHLPPLETWTTGFRIHPFLARIIPPEAWRKDEREVAEILEVDLEDLARPEARGEESIRFPSWPKAYTIRYYHVGRYKLWGATYRILEPLLPRLLAGEWDI